MRLETLEKKVYRASQYLLQMIKLRNILNEINIEKPSSFDASLRDKILGPIDSQNKAIWHASVAQMATLASGLHGYVEIDKISGDYLANLYNFDEYRDGFEYMTPSNVKKALRTLKVINVTDGNVIYGDLDHEEDYTLIKYDNNTYLSSVGGKYITQLI